MRRGFTIIELLMVIGIIAVLTTIVVIASTGAIHHARANRANAMRVALEQAVTTYYAQEGKWPETIETKAENSDDEVCSFSDSETDAIFREVVGKAYGKGSGKKSMLIDVSALFVADAGKVGNGTKRVFGLDFTLAANRNSKHYINFSNMAFGYPESEHGWFRRFRITYNTKTDSVTVSK